MARRRLRRFRKAVYSVQQKRPIDKQLVDGYLALTGTASKYIKIYPFSGDGGVTFPGTLTGFRWTISSVNRDEANANLTRWAIVKCREGLIPNALNNHGGGTVSSCGTMYAPEQDVIAWGQNTLNSGLDFPSLINNEGSTKSMRKMQNGDALYFVANDTSAAASGIMFIIQFFYKT